MRDIYLYLYNRRPLYLLFLAIISMIFFFTPSAVATQTNRTGQFVENHALGTTFLSGTGTTYATPETGGNHYKATDIMENGKHGFQLDSAILKDIVNGVNDPANAYGYVQGNNPFTMGTTATDMALPPPRYTEPCPVFNRVGGQCPLFFFGDATHPQTNGFPYKVCSSSGCFWTWVTLPDDNLAEVLDDIYSIVGANDSSGYNVRLLYENFDILFYMKDTSEFAPNGTNSVTGDLFFDTTLDQALSDYLDDPVTGVTKGVFNKLTNLYSFDQSQNPVEFIDQWLVSDAYDWQDAGSGAIENMWYGNEMAQGYSSWFKKNSEFTCPNINGEGPCTYTYQAGHGSITKTVPSNSHSIGK